MEDGLLAQYNQELPFPWHVVCSPQDIHIIEYMVVVVFMGTKKVVISHPQGKVIVGAIYGIKAVRLSIGSFVCAVEPLDHLFVGTEFFGGGILIGKPDDLGDAELKSITEFMEELLGGKRICAITVSNKTEVFGKLLKVTESHAHGQDTGADTPVIGDPVTDDGTFGGIHNEPDIRFDAAYFDVGFIGGKDTAGAVIVMIDKWFNADSGAFTVVSDLLMGDPDVVEVFKSLGSLTKRKGEVYMKSQA